MADGASTSNVHVALEARNVQPIYKNHTITDDSLPLCFPISPGTWSLRGCDGPTGNDQACRNPAISLSNIIISPATTTTTTTTSSTGTRTSTSATGTPGKHVHVTMCTCIL